MDAIPLEAGVAFAALAVGGLFILASIIFNKWRK